MTFYASSCVYECTERAPKRYLLLIHNVMNVGSGRGTLGILIVAPLN